MERPDDSASPTPAPRSGIVSHALMAAALALPGLAAMSAHAESAPEKGIIGLKYLNYQDWQPDQLQSGRTVGKRISVDAPSVYLLAPIGSFYSVEASGVLDTVSGASPFYHNTLSGGSGKGIHDYRKALDAKVTRYFDHLAVGVGGAYSKEHDYESNAASVDARVYLDNNLTTLAVGTGISSDKISSELTPTLHEAKHTNDFMVGVTRVLTPRDVVQSNITYASGHGYYTDPYKLATGYDNRPDGRRQFAWLTRWNHYFPNLEAALHLSYRYYQDSFGIKAHTVEGSWFQPLAHGWMLVPNLRYYSQRAASFYNDADLNPPNTAYVLGLIGSNTLYSADQRLSAFGGVTAGLKVVKELTPDVTVDLKGEYYEQRAGWRFGGSGSPGLLPFKATFVQLGMTKKF